MAEALVSVVLDQFTSVIRQEIEQEVRLVVGVRKEVRDLTTTLTMLQAFLRDADAKQIKDEAVKIWLEELKQIAYDADDVLDEWRTRILLSQLNQVTTSRITKKIRYCLFSPCSCFKPVVLRHQIGHEIVDIKERLDTIARTKTQLNLETSQNQQVLPRRATSSLVDVAAVYGRDDDKNDIVNWLLGEKSPEEIHMAVPILSIVGTGGFGKTTLAQMVFQQQKTGFELAIWVCVSQPFDREKVAKEIIEQAVGKKDRDFIGWEALHQQLSDSIKGKKILIVFDDVWTENPDDWSPLKLSLDGGAPGSRIIVTTRHAGVATMMGSRIRRLEELSDQGCWLLFQHIALAGRSQKERETLEEIGQQLAKKCKGVPLAAKTIASLMRFKQTKIEWRNVLENEIWKMQQREDGFLPSILLSYVDLPPELKQCFSYCAIFPKDETMSKDKLVKLWMAQGFLGLDGKEELEMTGEAYFDDLAMRSFFQDFEEGDNGKIVTCKMHDLVHDFAQFLTKAECLTLENNDTVVCSEKLRHINVSSVEFETLSTFKVRNLRTLILQQLTPNLPELFVQLTCLRSLDLSIYSLEELPNEVERLLHLRYLDLTSTRLKELPETLCNLYNLQCLRLSRCDMLSKLPDGMGRLLNLRHVEIPDSHRLVHVPCGIGRLKHLRTLSKFIVCKSSGGCKLEELRDLNFISGKLHIVGLMQVEDSNEAKVAELKKKKNIVSLELQFSKNMRSENDIGTRKRMKDIIECLQPHNNLEELRISEYPGLAFPLWMSTLSNLVKLSLSKCLNCTKLPAAISKLPSLDELELYGLPWSADILGIAEHVGETMSSSVRLFPKLRDLMLWSMHEWDEEILETTASTISIVPKLQKLSIGDCEKLKVIPNYIFSNTLKQLEITSCPNLVGMQRCGLPVLESLGFYGDVGVFSRSLMPFIQCKSLHNLKSFTLWSSSHSSLPQGFNHCASLEELVIRFCDSIDFNPEVMLSSDCFPMLRRLEILYCDVMTERCSRVNWNNLSHLSETEVEGKRIRR